MRIILSITLISISYVGVKYTDGFYKLLIAILVVMIMFLIWNNVVNKNSKTKNGK
ncbi:MAG: hypothetical protein WC389_15330 [Lutibacter sp.]